MISQDIQELKESLQLADKFLNEKLNQQGKAEEVLHAIVIKSLELINDEISVRDIYFYYADIYAAVWGEGDTDKASRTVRKYLDDISNNKLSANSELNQFLVSENCKPLFLTVDASAGGKRTQFYLITCRQVDKSTNEQSNNSIEYVATKLPKPYWWVKPLMEIKVTVWRVFCVVAIGVLLGWVGVYSLSKVFSGSVSTAMAIIVLIIAGIAGYLMMRLSELSAKGVTKIPSFMVPLKQANSLFTLVRDSGEEQQNLKILAVTYEAKCPLCGDKIIIEKSREFHGRYVGKCAITPSEHVYTFDHVLKKGRFLRD